MLVKAGTEGFTSELGRWAVLGVKALTEEYYPDFTAFGVGPCRILRISSEQYSKAQAREQVCMICLSQGV